MRRRRLLELAVLALTGLASPKSVSASHRADDVFKGIFGEIGLAAHIGRLHILRDAGAKARGRSLVNDFAALGRSMREKRLNQQKQADLAALDVVTIDGWVLARSEADLCAVVYLDRNQA